MTVIFDQQNCFHETARREVSLSRSSYYYELISEKHQYSQPIRILAKYWSIFKSLLLSDQLDRDRLQNMSIDQLEFLKLDDEGFKLEKLFLKGGFLLVEALTLSGPKSYELIQLAKPCFKCAKDQANESEDIQFDILVREAALFEDICIHLLDLGNNYTPRELSSIDISPKSNLHNSVLIFRILNLTHIFNEIRLSLNGNKYSTPDAISLMLQSKNRIRYVAKTTESLLLSLHQQESDPSHVRELLRKLVIELGIITIYGPSAFFSPLVHKHVIGNIIAEANEVSII